MAKTVGRSASGLEVDRTTASVDAHRDQVRRDFADIVAFLKDYLGVGAISVIAGGADAKTIGRWAEGGPVRRDRDAVEQRIRTAYQAYRMLQDVEASQTVRAWFLGMNPQLDDSSPIEALAEDQGRAVLSAARAFVSGG